MMSLTQAAAGFAALTTLSVGAWKTGEYLEVRPVIVKEWKQAQAAETEVLKGLVEQQSQMTTSLVELQFQTLAMKRKMGALDFMEQQQFCSLAKQLGYVGIESCDD
jgi:hypothetical protein